MVALPLSSSTVVTSVVGTMMIIDCPAVGTSSCLSTADGAVVGNVINRFGVGLILVGGTVASAVG